MLIPYHVAISGASMRLANDLLCVLSPVVQIVMPFRIRSMWKRDAIDGAQRMAVQMAVV